MASFPNARRSRMMHPGTTLYRSSLRLALKPVKRADNALIPHEEPPDIGASAG